jgi:Leucine-rich repeat (LRR) protein
MTSCRHFYGFFTDALRDLELTQCGPICGDLSSLHRLTLHSCTIEQVTKMSPSLEYLELNANYSALGSDDWSADAWDLGLLTKLKVLKISTAHALTNKHMAGVRHMHELEHLTVTGCPNVTDFCFLEGLSNLRHLQVSNTFDWSMLKHVQLDSFSATEFDLEQLLYLGTQRRLQFLRIDQGRGDIINRVDPGPVLASLMPHWTNLRVLDLFFCTQLIDTSGFTLCAGLNCLKLDFCKLIDDHKLEHLLRSFPCLEILSLKFTRVSDKGLCYLPTSVRDLALRGCEAVTDNAMPFLRLLKGLTSLDISHTRVSKVDTLPRSLQTLYITGSGGLIGPESLLELRRRRGKRVKIVQDY